MTLLPGAIWVGPINPNNYTPTRYGVPISEIIDHHTDGSTWQAALAAFNASYGPNQGRSAHLIIDRNDPINDVYECLYLEHTAWGATDWEANKRGINIEHVRAWDTGYEPITPGQYKKSREVHIQLSQMFGFPLDSDHVHPHNFYWPTTCPGDMDLGQLIGGGLTLDPDVLAWFQAIGVHLNAIVHNPTGGTGFAPYENQGALDRALAAIAALPAQNNAAVLAAIADLRAHPAVQADPVLMGKVDALSKHLGVGTP